jgi:hypothetical protein
VDTIRFFGALHPKARVGLKGTGTFTRNGRPLSIKFNVFDSQLYAECSTDTFTTSDFSDIYSITLHFIRLQVCLFGFAKGLGFVPVIEGFVTPDGTYHPAFRQYEDLAERASFNIDDAVERQQVAEIFRTNRIMQMALFDLIQTITTMDTVHVNCNRVMESIRRTISPNVKNESKAWEAMHAALNISQDYQKFISDVSKKPRHGNRDIAPNFDEAKEITQRSWTIMNRYIEYERRGKQPLNDPNFPFLG